jgi:hypothetical protein
LLFFLLAADVFINFRIGVVPRDAPPTTAAPATGLEARA